MAGKDLQRLQGVEYSPRSTLYLCAARLQDIGMGNDNKS